MFLYYKRVERYYIIIIYIIVNYSVPLVVQVLISGLGKLGNNGKTTMQY